MKTEIAKGKVVAEPTKVREIITVAPEEVQNHLEWGKALFKTGQYEEALEEFKTVLRTAPGSIETRILIRQTKEALARPEAEAAAEEETTPAAEAIKPKECLWMKLGVVSYRHCTRNYDCLTCEFDQTMQEQMAKREMLGVDGTLEGFNQLPGNQIMCRYALTGDISHRLCTRLFHCATCEFGQNMEDALQQKLDKLAARREALRKKEVKA